jgi:type IV pilus assembly protein PilF
MKRSPAFILSILVLVLAGCAGSPEYKKIDTAKAAEANATLGVRYMQQGNYELAMKKLKKSISFDDEYGPAHHYIAELYRRLEKYEKADEHYRDALRYSDEDYALYNNYGVFLCGQDRYEEGEAQLLKVLGDPVYPHKEQVYENLGICAERKSNLERAEEYLRSALRMNPRQSKSLLAMARISFTQGKYLSTRAYLQRFLEVARHTAESLWLGIRAERLLGDNNAVASYGLMLKSNFPDSDEAKLYLESGN